MRTLLFIEILEILLNTFQHYRIKHSEIRNWKRHCEEFEQEHGIAGGLCGSVRKELERYQYPLDIIDGNGVNAEAVASSTATGAILTACVSGNVSNSYAYIKHLLDDNKSKRLVFGGERIAHVPSSPFVDAALLVSSRDSRDSSHLFSRPSSIPHFLRSKQSIIIYQSKGYVTGGTVALELLHRQFQSLGFDSLLCDQTNAMDTRCSHPAGGRKGHCMFVYCPCYVHVVFALMLS